MPRSREDFDAAVREMEASNAALEVIHKRLEAIQEKVPRDETERQRFQQELAEELSNFEGAERRHNAALEILYPRREGIPQLRAD